MLPIAISSGVYGTHSTRSHYDVILIVTSFATELATPTVTDVRTPYHTTTTTTTTVLWPFFRDHPGEPVQEENFWTLWCKGRLTEADTMTIQLGATPSGLTSAHVHHPPIFFTGQMPLPAAQPTVSKH